MSESKQDGTTNGLNIEAATSTLDRTIEFRRDCENKTSILIGILGVGIAIFFTDEGIRQLKVMIKFAIKEGRLQDIVYLTALAISLFLLALGITLLVRVLIAKIDSSDFKQDGMEMDSKVYFGHISCNQSYSKYKMKLAEYGEEDHLNDLVSQIYINSMICVKKFRRYKKGFAFTLIGTVLFIATWVLGIIIY